MLHDVCTRFFIDSHFAMLTIRTAAVKDVGLIRELILELAEFEKCPEQVRTTEADISRDGFGSHPEFRALIAEWQDAIAGFALFFNHYSTWRGAGLYLEDLFVRREFRERGIGRALVARVARIAEQENRSFIRWSVLDWNEPAIALYGKLGADFLDEWRPVLLADENLKGLSGDLPSRCI
jgi:GNAT superfamily N-acetyltransferase